MIEDGAADHAAADYDCSGVRFHANRRSGEWI
jgi:hypothetical protein